MEDLNINVLKGFKIKARSIKKEKSSYIIQSDSGTKIIQKTFVGPKSLLFQNEIKKHLYENGFKNTDIYYFSAQEKPFFELNNEYYVMTDYIEGRSVDFSVNEEFKRTLETIAGMHNLLKKSNIPEELKLHRKDELPVLYAKRLNEFVSLKKRVKKQSKLSDFDVIFLKNYDYYTDNIKKSLEIFKNVNFAAIREKAGSENQICHNMIKEEYLFIDRKGVTVTNFNGSLLDTYVIDLADIIKRYIKSFGPNRLGLSEILEIYTSVNALTKDEIDALQPLLLYPAKFVKICTQYYAKKRTWVPSALNARMSVLIERKDAEKEFIEDFYK